MALAGRLSLSLVHTGILLAIVLLPDFLGAVPVGQDKGEEVEDVSAVSGDVKEEAMASLKKLVRNRRNVPGIPLAQFKRVPDFWAWYKYYMDSHNQEGVENLDLLYMAYLQNKHRSEENPRFNHYLNHLSQIYKTCADSDDPECIAESTSKPKAEVVMPAPVRMCNPYLDPYCLFPAASKAAAPAPAKVPAPVFSPLLPAPLKSPGDFYYYGHALEPFLSAEQQAELLRICNPKDVECLQYHLRAAYGYRPAHGPAPSYAALNCDPKDPYCRPLMVQQALTGYYHLLYPNCDPAVDPLCVATAAGPAPLAANEAPKGQPCNPLFDAGCNPLTAGRLSGVIKDPVCHPHDPYCILAAAALRKPVPPLPEYQVRYKLGVRGRTKEGHDCYVHYDKGCTPLEPGAEAKADIEAPARPFCHPFDPSCNKLSSPASVEAPKPATGGVILPDPHCDPEIDYNCRLRRAEPAAAGSPAEPRRATPSFEDFLRGYLGQYKK